MEKANNKRKRGRKPKNPVSDTNSSAADDVAITGPTQVYRRGRGCLRKTENHNLESDTEIAASPERGVSRFSAHNGSDCTMAYAPPLQRWESGAKVMPSMDAVVKVFCVHTEPNFSLPWQRKRQYSSSSSGFIIGGRRVLTNAHSVEHHIYSVLAIGTECDIAI